jgi:hypothetical protein
METYLETMNLFLEGRIAGVTSRRGVGVRSRRHCKSYMRGVEEGEIGWGERQKQRNIISFNTHPETLDPNP